jgi:hypothetical protein
MRWKAEIEWLYYGDKTSDTNSCWVRRDGREFVIDYEADGKRAVLKGRDEADGHLGKLQGLQGDSTVTMTLHIKPGELIGVGYWVSKEEEEEDRGLCRLRLIRRDDGGE